MAQFLKNFCKKITLFTNIGQKNNEKKFIKNNLEKNIKTIFLNKNNSPTITKKRFVDLINKTKIFGVYSLNDQPLDRDQESKLNRKIQKLIKNHDLVIVSDYGHGLISDKTAKLIVKKVSNINTY